MMQSLGKRLEQYTQLHPEEILLLKVECEGSPDEITVFKGFSSSLMRPTAFDPDCPVLKDNAKVLTIDRIASPYDPADPRYIQRNLDLDAFMALLERDGL
ncbi:MAG TPA: hypothetical protein V6D19_15180 [Stenomitos sp.]